MEITLRTPDTTQTLANHQTALRQTEALGLRLLSLTTGQITGRRANIVTFVQQDNAPTTPLTLEVVDGALDQDAQEGNLNRPGRELVCYGSLFVSSTARNVAAWRIGGA